MCLPSCLPICPSVNLSVSQNIQLHYNISAVEGEAQAVSDLFTFRNVQC